MSSIIKTRTQGFRVSTFRNQEVHKYYNHLQSVMRSIDSNGTYSDLFAKPEIDAMAVGETEIEWTCSSSSKAVHLSQLSDSERNRVEKIVSDAYNRIEAYVAENRMKSGKNRDYAQFLSIVGKRPDPNQIWVVNGKPVIVQWGFVDENGLMGSSGIYSDWDSFIKDIRKAEPEKPKEEPVMVAEEPAKTETVNEAVVAAPAAASSLFAEQEKVVEKTAEPAPQPKQEEPKAKPVEKKEEPKTPPKKVDTEQKKTVYAGLGGYEWVKWVAILLAIIILLILLLRLLFPPRFPNDLLGQNGTNIGAINGGGMGGSGGGAGGGSDGGGNGGGGQGGGDNGAGGQNGGGNQAIKPNEPCPVCSKPFGNHGPEDYKKCILKASKGGAGNGGTKGAGGNGEGSGSPAGSDQNGIVGGNAGQGSSGSPSGAGASNGGSQGGSNGSGQGASEGTGSNGGAGQQGSAKGAGGNGEGSGSPAGSDQNGIAGGNAGQGSSVSPSGAGSSNGDGQGGSNGGGQGGSENAGSNGGAGQQGRAKDSGGNEGAVSQGTDSDKGSSDGSNGEKTAVEPSKKQDDNKGFDPEDICPVCNRQFKLHSEEDLKDCILASQRDKVEVQKKFERLKSATTNYNKAVKELNSENSADNIGEK